MTKEKSGISELLEIVFHYILYAKMIYPAQIFEKRIRCNLPIWKCKYPPVCSYISNFFVFLERLLGEEPLDVAFLVIGKSGEMLEEYVFEIQYPKEVENGKTPPKFRLEELLSSIALALNSVSSSKSNCRGNTFQLQVRSNCSKVSLEDIKDDLKNEKFPWTASENPESEPWSKIIPLQTVDNSRFKVQIYQLQREIEIIDIT